MAALDPDPRALARQSYDALWQRRGDLLRVAVVPVGLTLVIDVVLFVLAPADPAGSELGLGGYLLILLSIPPGVLLAVNWLRVLILGSGSVAGLGVRWGARETRFFLRMLALGLAGLLAALVLLMPVMLLFGLLMGGQAGEAAFAFSLFITVATVLIYLYVSLRFSLALAAAAIDGPGTLMQSWAATKGIGLQLVLAAILTVGPFYLLVFLLPALLASSGVVAAAPLTSLLLQVVLGSLTSAAGFALVAVVHRRLSGSPTGTAT